MNLRLKHAATALLLCAPSVGYADFNGAYAGLAAGPNLTNDVINDDGTFEADDSLSFGVIAGYRVQNGSLVFGGELAISSANDLTFDVNGTERVLDYTMVDLKGQVGYALDNILLFGTLGFSRITNEADENAPGIGFGFGADYDLGNNIILGAEYYARRTEPEDLDNVEVNVDTLTLRAAFTF